MVIQTVLGRFQSPPKVYPADVWAAKNRWQGPEQMYWCDVDRTWCDKDCASCLEYMASCDRCFCGGHIDSAGWFGFELDDGAVRVLCHDCYEIELNEKEGQG